MGKVRVSNGKDTLEIEGADLPAAVKDGYKPTERIIVANSKTKESFEIDPQDVESALGEGFSFTDIVKKAQGPPKDVMTLAKERAGLQTQYDATKDLSKNTGVKNAFEPQLAGVDEQLKVQGYDPDFAKDIVELPEGEGFSAKESLPGLQKLKRENPGKYYQELSSIKSKGGIFNLVRNKSGIKNAGAVIQGLQGLEKQDYRTATKEGFNLINTYSDDVDEQNKLKKEWVAAKAFDYGTQPIAPDVQEQFSHLSPYQQRAMQFLKDTDKPTFEAYARLLTPGFEDQWMGSNETSMRRGREMKEREVENIGMGLMQRAMEQKLTDYKNKELAGAISDIDKQEYQTLSQQLNELDNKIEDNKLNSSQQIELDDLRDKMNELNDVSKLRPLRHFEVGRYNRWLERAKELIGPVELFSKRNELVQKINGIASKYKGRGLSAEDQEQFDALVEDYKLLATDKESQNSRYPNIASMDADRLMQESMGANNSVAKKFALGVGANFDDAINWAGDLIQDRGVNGNLELLGDKELTASVQRYTPEKDKLIGSDVVAKFDEGLQKDIEAVKADTKLSDDQKRDQISKLIKDNPDQVSYAPNDKAGKTNFTAKAILNTVGDVGSDLVSQLAIASLGGAANSASKVKQLSSLFGSTFATAYNDYYNDALKQNMPNPTQYALLHTTIEAASELIHNDFDVAKKIAGKTGTLGKIMGKITKGEWDDIVKMGRFSKLKAAALQTGQTALSSARKETLEETAGQIGGNIADEQVFNKETGVGEGVKDTMITTFVGMLPLGLLSLPFNYQNINRTQKYAMYEAGNNPDKFLAQIQSDLANGSITPQEAQERKDNIDKAVKAVQKSTAVRTDGTPMTDNEKTEYAFNQAVLDEIKEQTQSAPAAVKEELKEKQEKIEEEQTKLVKPKKKKAKPKEEVVEEVVAEETQPEQAKPKIIDKDGNEFSLHQKEDEKGDITLTVIDESGKFTTNNVKGDKSVGTLELYKDPDGYYPQLVTVNKELRRKGIATQLFDYAEKNLGLKIKPTTDLSKEGEAFMKTRPSQINTVEDLERELTNALSTETAPIEEEKQKEETPPTPVNKEEKTGPPVEKKELSEKQDYAYKNSWRFYSQKYPEDSHEDFVKNSSEARKIIKGNRGAPLPKLGEINAANNQRPADEDITQYTPQSIIDKSRQFYEGDELITRVANFLEPIIKANPNIRIDTEAKIKPGVLGYSYPDGRVELNFDQIQDYDTLYRTGLHELMHAATRHEINNNPAFRGELETVLSEIRDAMKLGENGNIISALVGAGVIDANKYGAANEHEMIAEVFTNQAFNDMLRNIEYKGDNLLHRIFLAIAKFFSEKYKQITGAKKDISVDNIADYLMELTESVISSQQQESENQDALPLLAPTKTNDLLIKIAKKALDKISETDVRAKLKQIANLDDATIDEIIAAAKGVQPATPPASRQLTPAEIGEMPEERKPKNLLRKKYERYFTSSKGLPKWMMALKDKATGTLQLEVRRALRLVNETKTEAKKLGFVDWDLFDKAIREQYYASDLTALKALPPELQVLAVEMRNKIDSLSRDLIINNYVTPEQALNIEANIGEYMTRSYKAFNEKNWAKKVPKKVREDAFRFLVQDYFTQADPALTEDEAIDWARKKAQNKVEEIIAGIDDKYTPGKVAVNKGKDMGILKRREDIPKEIRDLLGEYTDPGVNFAMTIARIASLKSNAEYLTKLKDMGLGNIFFEEDNKPPEASVQIAAEGSETWNPLNGLYTTPEVKEIFKEAEADTNKLVKGYLKVVGAIRWGKTVGSVVTQVKNFESNLGFAVLNGHYRAGKAGQSFKYLVDKLFKGDKSEDALIEKVIKLGVIGQSVGIRELKNMFRKDNLDSIILDSSLNEKTGIRKLGKTAMKPIDYLNKIYATSDDFWKIYGFLNEAEALSQTKFNKSYKDLTEDEQNDIDTEASERVKNTYPTYDRVWEGARYVSKGIPIVGNFLSFQAESLRVLRNAVSYAIKDIQNPETRAMGARRLAGIATYLTARSMILYGIAQLTGVGLAGLLGAGNDDDEDQRLKDINRYAAPFMRSSEKFVKDHGDGTYTVYDVGSLEPYGIVFKTMNAFTSGNKTVKEPGLGAAATELLGPFLEEEMVFGTLVDIYNNENQSGSLIYNPLDPFGEQAADATLHGIKKLNPSTIDYIKRLVGSEDKENELAALFGGRGYEVDVLKNFKFKLVAASQLFEANRSFLGKVKYNPDSTPDDIAEAEEKYTERQERLVMELNEDYEAAIRLGVDVKMLDTEISKKPFWKGYNKKTKHQIKTGIIEDNKNEPELKEWQP